MNPAFNYVLNRPCPRVCRLYAETTTMDEEDSRYHGRTPIIMRIRKRKKVASTNETWLVRAYLRRENVYTPPTTFNLTCDAPFLCNDFPFPTCTPYITCIGCWFHYSWNAPFQCRFVEIKTNVENSTRKCWLVNYFILFAFRRLIFEEGLK